MPPAMRRRKQELAPEDAIRIMEEGAYGGLVLAAAGLIRLGLEHRVSRYFAPEELLPAAGQGILAVQCRADMDRAVFDCLRDREAELCALAELLGLVPKAEALPRPLWQDADWRPVRRAG